MLATGDGKYESASQSGPLTDGSRLNASDSVNSECVMHGTAATVRSAREEEKKEG